MALPPGADPERVAAAGDFAVAPTPEGALTSSTCARLERGQISLGRFEPSTINGLAISPEGDVAATVPVGDGDDVLLWAPAGDDRVRVLATGAQFARVAVAGGRVAFVGADGLRDGVRVRDRPATRAVVFRGPPAFDVTALGFDGRDLAFARRRLRLRRAGRGVRVAAARGPVLAHRLAVDAALEPRRLVRACAASTPVTTLPRVRGRAPAGGSASGGRAPACLAAGRGGSRSA